MKAALAKATVAGWVREVAHLPASAEVSVEARKNATHVEFIVPGESAPRHYLIAATPSRLGFADVAKVLMQLGPGCGESHEH